MQDKITNDATLDINKQLKKEREKLNKTKRVKSIYILLLLLLKKKNSN